MYIRAWHITQSDKMNYWKHILERCPETPEQFMAAIYEIKPGIDENDVLRWQRASRDWTTNVFDFVWFNIKLRQGELQWRTHIQALWPNIKSILDAEHLEQLFNQLKMT